MQEVIVSLARDGAEPTEVPGFRFKETPGLVITESIQFWDQSWPLPDRPWNVTHFLSGLLMVSCLDKAHAERVMAEMAKLPVDWLVPADQIKITGEDLKTLKRIKSEAWRVKDMAEEAAWESAIGLPLVIEDLAPAPVSKE
jgi:hypothetical protein